MGALQQSARRLFPRTHQTLNTAQILDILARVAETDEVRTNPDLALYDLQILDSMKTVELITTIMEELGVAVSPSEFDREAWATPALIIADVKLRMTA